MARKRTPRTPTSTGWGTHTRTSTQRGYGQAHRTARLEALAKHQPWHPCTRCGHPLGAPGPWLHLDHNKDRTAYLGLAHAKCNIKAGAIAGATSPKRGKWARPTPTRRQSEQW